MDRWCVQMACVARALPCGMGCQRMLMHMHIIPLSFDFHASVALPKPAHKPDSS